MAFSHATFSLEAFAQVRDRVRALSHTDDISTLLHQRVAMLKEAERQRQEESHAVDIEWMDPSWMADNWNAGLNKTLPNGAKFTLADHQQRGLQKLFDNDLRVLLAHFMGTGKTVSALSACKMARRAQCERVSHRVRRSPAILSETLDRSGSKITPSSPALSIRETRSAASLLRL